jgi:cytochrome P450
MAAAATGNMLTDLAPRTPEAITPVRRSALKVLFRIIRNPLDALPPAVFHAPLVHIEALGRQRFYVTDPPLIQDVLVNNADALKKGPELRRSLAAMGEGLLTGDGAHWRWQRQSSAPIFRHERLLAYLPAMLAAANDTRDRWLALGQGATIDIGHEMMRTTFDIIVETMLSGRANIDVAKVERAVTDYLEATGWVFALSLLKAPEWMPYPGQRRARRAGRYLRGEVGRIAAARRAGDSQSGDLIDLLMAASDPETGRSMTDGEITDNLLTFVTAGHETTALGLAWTFDLLSRNPDCEARAVAEIEAISEGGVLRPEHVGQLAYTRQIFQEAMRLYPPVAIIARVVSRPFMLGGRPVPEGSMVYVPIYALHRHRMLWERPEEFDPDRFAPDIAKDRHRYGYLPFGGGPRVCIGSGFAMLEGVAILATLLRAVRLRSIADNPPRPRMRLTLRPSEKLMMRVEARR